MLSPKHLHIFLSSPSDVAEEREIARRIISELPYDPFLRGQITIDIVAWDGPGGGVPMSATTTPQSAINLGLRRPSDCEIVVVILWARLGTLLSEEYRRDDGTRYSSGTEWEFEDALRSNEKTEILVYRRISTVPLDPQNPQYEEQLSQRHRVQAFFETFKNPDGSLKRGFNNYHDPGDFQVQFVHHLKEIIKKLLPSVESLESHVTRDRSSHQWQPAEYEEPRRLDAAMPRRTVATHPTEVWAQICLPSSEGLRGALPHSDDEEDTTPRDVREGKLPVLFTIDPATHNPLPAHLLIEVQAPDFDPAQSRHDVLLVPSRDSGILVFNLTPMGERDRTKVYVTVRQQVEGPTMVTLGSVVLVSRIGAADLERVIDPVWTLVHQILGSVIPGSAQSADSDVNALQNFAGRAHIELKVVEDLERKTIEKYLKLDIPLLCSLISISDEKPRAFSPSGQIARGQALLEELKPVLRETLCNAWQLCEKIQDEAGIDKIELIATIAEVISPVVHNVPAILVSTILVKLGVRRFCDCQNESRLGANLAHDISPGAANGPVKNEP